MRVKCKSKVNRTREMRREGRKLLDLLRNNGERPSLRFHVHLSHLPGQMRSGTAGDANIAVSQCRNVRMISKISMVAI
jgi:hypothetical protein